MQTQSIKTMPFTMSILIRGNTLSSGCATAIKNLPLSLSLSPSARLLLVATEVCLSKVACRHCFSRPPPTPVWTSTQRLGSKSSLYDERIRRNNMLYVTGVMVVLFEKKAHIWISMLLKKDTSCLDKNRKEITGLGNVNRRGCDRQLRY